VITIIFFFFNFYSLQTAIPTDFNTSGEENQVMFALLRDICILNETTVRYYARQLAVMARVKVGSYIATRQDAIVCLVTIKLVSRAPSG
jgi:hypothetical protein